MIIVRDVKCWLLLFYRDGKHIFSTERMRQVPGEQACAIRLARPLPDLLVYASPEAAGDGILTPLVVAVDRPRSRTFHRARPCASPLGRKRGPALHNVGAATATVLRGGQAHVQSVPQGFPSLPLSGPSCEAAAVAGGLWVQQMLWPWACPCRI